MITCYISPASSLEDVHEMVRNTKQLTVYIEITHKFATGLSRLSPMCIGHDTPNFSDHISSIVPNIIMDTINFEAMLHKIDLGNPSFLEIDEAMHDDYA